MQTLVIVGIFAGSPLAVLAGWALAGWVIKRRKRNDFKKSLREMETDLRAVRDEIQDRLFKGLI